MSLDPSPQDKRGIVLKNFDNTYDARNYPNGDKPVPTTEITDLSLVSKSSDSVILSWTGIDEVVALERATSPGSFSVVQSGIAAGSSGVTDSGLSSETEYYYRLTFASGTSNTITVTTNAAAVLPASTQLSEGNYSPRNVDPILIYPRPDSETAAWAKHRRHYPGIGYRTPIGVAFGSGPQVFEVIDGPPGAYIGEFLVVDGDRLVPNEDYGVFKVDNPTVGTYSCHVRVYFQDGFAPMDVQWTLEVTSAGTIFIDRNAVDGDTLGDGSEANPFQTINAWWKNDLTDTTFSEYQVCYRAGTHDVAAENSNTGVDAGSWQLNGTDKPLVHYPYPGENVIFDMTNTTIGVGGAAPVGGGQQGSDLYFGAFEFLGGRLTTTDNPRQFFIFASVASSKTYAAGGGGQRMTWDSPTHKDFVVETTSTNNAGPLWATKAEGVNPDKRHFIYIHRPTFINCRMSATATDPGNENLNGYYFSSVTNLLSDHITCVNTNFGYAPVHSKAGGRYWCIRWVDMSQAENQSFHFELLSSYDTVSGGPMELSYIKARQVGTSTNEITMYINNSAESYDSQNPEHLPAYVDRCTISRAPVSGRSALRVGGGWPYYLKDCIFVADDLVYLVDPDPTGDFIRYDVANNPLDSSLNLTGSDRTSYLGLYGAEVKNEGF